MEKKFTKRELYDALIGKLCGEEVEVDAQILVDFCQAEIDRIDQRNAKDREKREAKKAEPDVAREKVFAVVDEQFRTADAIHDLVDDEEITLGKVRHRLASLVRDGLVKKQEMKVPGGEGEKARHAMCYARA